MPIRTKLGDFTELRDLGEGRNTPQANDRIAITRSGMNLNMAVSTLVAYLNTLYDNGTLAEEISALSASTQSQIAELASNIQSLQSGKVGSVRVAPHEDNSLAYDIIVDGRIAGTIQTIKEESLSHVVYDATNRTLTFTYTSKDNFGNDVNHDVVVNVADMVSDYTAGSGIAIENRQVRFKGVVLTEAAYEALEVIDDDTYYYTYEDEDDGGGAYVTNGILYISGIVSNGVLSASGRVENGVFYPTSGSGTNASVQDGVVSAGSRVENGVWIVRGTVDNGVLTL